MLLKNDTTHGYFPVSDAVFATGFYLTGAGVERVGPNQSYPLSSHPDMYEFSWNTGRVLPEYQMVLIHSGEGEFESQETGLVQIHAGMAMLLIPDVWHRYRPNPKTGWEEFWISFNGQLPHIWQQAGVISPHSAVRSIAHAKSLVKKLEKIVESAVKNPADGYAASFSALAILAGILGRDASAAAAAVSRPARAEAGSPAPSDDAVANAALGVIWNYSHQNLSVGRIADQIGVTRRKLERRFLAACNRTVLQELTACRISRAQRMLRETHLPIKYIATAVGFSSPTHLPTVFRRELKTTPRQYRDGETTGPRTGGASSK